MGVRFAKIIKNKTRYVKKRTYKNFDEQEFLEEIRKISWWDVYSTIDVNEAVRLLSMKVNFILNRMAPVRNFQTTTKYCSLSFVHPDAVRKIILGLKNSKSCGVDNIDTYVLKLMIDDILPAVTHIVNLSIQNSVFPSQYKVAKVIPLLKKDDPLEPKNYRPVAILPILSKVIERVIFVQIIEYMNTKEYFHPNNNGFRAHHSTSTAMIQMYDSWVQAVDKGELGVCMLDMLAAFDVVDHDILLSKLKLYEFDEDGLKTISLEEPNQFILMDPSPLSCQ